MTIPINFLFFSIKLPTLDLFSEIRTVFNFIDCFPAEIFLSIAILSLAIFSVTILRLKDDNEYRISRPFLFLNLISTSIFILIVCLFLVFFSPVEFCCPKYENSSFFFSEFSLVGETFYSSDYLSYFSKIILIFISVHFLFFFKVYLPVAKVSRFETILLFLISILASFFLLRANDLMAFYLSIELQTLCFYLLIISKKRDFISITSALKYFLLGTAFSAILLFGLSIVYTTLGTTTYEKISLLTFSLNNIEKHQIFFDAFAFSANLYNKYFQFKIGCFFISIAFLFKLNAFPFHLWSPDVYEGTPRILTAFFLIIPKFTVIISFVRLLSNINVDYSMINLDNIFFLPCSLFTFVLGVFFTITQTRLKRFLIFSSMADTGFMLLIFYFRGPEFYLILFFYLIGYSIMGLLVWMMLVSIRNKADSESFKSIRDFTAFGQVNSNLGLGLGFTFLSFLGLPPFLGFILKYYYFTSVLTFINIGGSYNSEALVPFHLSETIPIVSDYSNEEFMFLFLKYGLPISYLKIFLVLIAILSALTCVYYLRILKTLYFDKPKNKEIAIFSPKLNRSNAILIAFNFVLVICFFPSNPNTLLAIAGLLSSCLL